MTGPASLQLRPMLGEARERDVDAVHLRRREIQIGVALVGGVVLAGDLDVWTARASHESKKSAHMARLLPYHTWVEGEQRQAECEPTARASGGVNRNVHSCVNSCVWTAV